MRIHIGPIPEDPAFLPESGGWHLLKEPSWAVFMLWAVPASFVSAVSMILLWGAIGRLHSIDGQVVAFTLGTLVVSLFVMLGLILVHEFVHAAALPGWGLSSATVLGFWPSTMTPYLAYEGELTRTRSLAVGLSPFILLSVVPLLIALVTGWMPWWLVTLSTVNAFGSSGDLIGVALTTSGVPSGAMIRNKGRATWWRG